jgi:RNA 2',3'-cyclic 3'-phosphodiesterase
MRLFTALELPSDVRDKVEELLIRLRPTAPLRWSPPENLHITTKFIGEWPEERLEELKNSLAALPSRDPIPVHIRDFGAFLSPNKPRFFWVGVSAPELSALAADTESATTALGVDAEDRAYSPHVTVARVKEGFDIATLREAIAKERGLDFGRFEAHSFFLYRSESKPGGSVYTKLAEFPLSHS